MGQADLPEALDVYARLLGRPDGAAIVQEGAGIDGRPIRWTFTSITADAFGWQGHISDDGGTTWRLEQEMQARRQRPVPAGHPAAAPVSVR